MANTTKVSDNGIMLKLDDATDWTLADDMAGFTKSGLFIKSIKFVPSGANDVLVVKSSRDGASATATAREIFNVKCVDATDARMKSDFALLPLFPFIDKTDCTFATAANVRVLIELA